MTEKVRFTDAHEMAEKIKDISGSNEMYVYDESGNLLTSFSIRETTATDGFKTYDIVFHRSKVVSI